ncbi:hypothetical protein [uncultured Dokdonia sp.]|uniref:hypothetical protein n=1 Tax=uncultured Dokdonia sp. TaxID=575653 RepID=UPI002611DCC7|nr:hypothetical protein [uncultured Dokdonia sp.]
MNNKTDLNNNKTDKLISLAKSVVGAVPFAGTLLSELVENIIPNQRLERLSNYIEELDKKISKIPSEKIDKLIKSDFFVDLIEESFVQASRAFTIERREYIATIVANGITDNSIELQDSKYLLKILQELNDIEIIWLKYYTTSLTGDIEFKEKHKNVLTRVQVYMNSENETRQKAFLQKSYSLHLERLGLVRNHTKINKKTLQPEVDRTTGNFEISYTTITELGNLLLEQIGLIKSTK